MEYIKENLNTTYMNIETFSKHIAENWNVDSDIIRNYIFANISVGLIKNKEMKNDINKLYLLDKLRYYDAARNSSCINHIIMTHGTLEQEIHARKVLGILLVAEVDSDLRSSVIKLLRKYYPLVFNSVKKRNIKELKIRYQQMDEVTKKTETRLDAAIYFYFAIYRSADLVDQDCIASIINDVKNFEFGNPLNANIDNELQNHKSEIQEIKAILKRNFGKIYSYKDVLNNNTECIEELGAILENLFIINKLDIDYIFYNSDFLNIDEILLAHIKIGKNTLEPTAILQTLINGIFIQSLINEYKNARNLYFENNQETLFFKQNFLQEKLDVIQEENKEIKETLYSLHQEKLSFDETLNNQINKLNKSHKAETNSMQNRIKELENQLLEEKKYRNELNALREYIFEVNNNYVPKHSDKTLKDYIAEKKILIIGGSKNWRRKFREKYPELRTLTGFNENFEVSILNDIDYIFFYTGFMSHATYYKAMNFIRTHQIKFSYIGKTNMDLVEEEIIEELQKISGK